MPTPCFVICDLTRAPIRTGRPRSKSCCPFSTSYHPHRTCLDYTRPSPRLRSLWSHWPATSAESQTSLHSLYASGGHRPATLRRTRGISSVTSFADLQSLDLLPCPVRRQCVAWDRQGESAGYPSLLVRV